MTSGIRSFRDLDVWQAAMDLVVECYRLTDTFPPSERYGLTSQIRRSSCSIPSNIAEGHNRRATRVYLHHVNVALGSEAELETHLEIAFRLGLVSRERLRTVTEQRAGVGRMLSRLASSLRQRVAAGSVAVLSMLVALCASFFFP